MKSASDKIIDQARKHIKNYDKIALYLQKNTSRYFMQLILFIVLYKLGQYTFNFFESVQILGPVFDKVYYALSSLITTISVKFYSPFYASIVSDAEFCISINNVRTIQINPGCTGLLPIFQILFILLIFPLTVKQKIFFFPISLSIIVFAAILHYIILIPVAYASHDSFKIFHDIFSRAIFYVFFFANFVLWNRSSGKIKKGANKNTN
ncbi:MAG: exosortase/archaeosortase family protein [Bacteroidetes bacterium]|nr:exosortase/archaeosortase family protein [Bacteroidota bacterium]